MLWMLHPDCQARQCVATSCSYGAVTWLARVGTPQPSGKCDPMRAFVPLSTGLPSASGHYGGHFMGTSLSTGPGRSAGRDSPTRPDHAGAYRKRQFQWSALYPDRQIGKHRREVRFTNPATGVITGSLVVRF
jgi:hypothetical protein